MFRKAFASIVRVGAVTSLRAAGPTITIDAAAPAGNVSRLFYAPSHALVVLTLEAR